MNMPRQAMTKNKTSPRTLSALATLWLAALLCLWSGVSLAGNITSRSTVNGTTAYEYDVMNRLAKVTDSRGGVTTYTYDAAGRLLTTTYPNGTDGLREYDNNGHLLQVAWRQTATGQVVTATRYTLLPNGMRETLSRYDGQSSVQVTNAPGANGQGQAHWELGNAATTIAYTYDSLQRLTGEHQVSHRQDSPYQELTNHWTYDSTGNRLTQEHTVLGWSGGSSVETTSYRYDSRDRLQDSTLVTNTGSSVTTTYDWDDNGRLVRKTSPGEVTLYGWRSDDRLLWVKRGATEASAVPVAAYDYNVDGIRVRRTAGDGTVTDYLTDPNFTYAQTLEESEWGGSVSGKRLTRYEWGNALIAGLPVGDGQGSGERYYHQDGLGSVTSITDIIGGSDKIIEYDAFGSSSSYDASGFAYSGEYFDYVARFQYNRARWLDKTTSTFISRDAFIGVEYLPRTLNFYLYALSDAVNYTDPSGYIFSISSLTITQFVNGYVGRPKEAHENYRKYQAIVGSLCKNISKIAKNADHHALPKFAGGNKVAIEYASIPVEVHKNLHSLLSYALVINGFPGPNTKKYKKIMTADAFDKGKVIAVIRDVSQYVDTACKGYPNFNEISPVLEKVISSLDYIF